MYPHLKDLRISLNMTQKEFAKSLGIGYTTYNGYESGAREPKSDFWIKVATTYGVTIDYLMGYSNDPTQKSPSAEESAPGDQVTLEESNRLLVALGYIQEGDDLSDEDLAFLSHIVGLLDAWFRSKGK